MKSLFIILSLILFMLYGCGYHQIRFTKVVQNDAQEVGLTNEQPPQSRDILDNELAPLYEYSLPLEEIVLAEHVNDNNLLSVQNFSKDKIGEDSLMTQYDIPQDVIIIAENASNRAKTAKGIFIGGSILSVFMPLAGLILYLVGMPFYIRSRQSRFITQAGEVQLRKAKIAMIVNATLLFLITVLIITAIFLF